MTCSVKSSSAFASGNEIGLEGAPDLRGGRCPLQRSARTPSMDAWAFACHGLWKIPGRRSRFAQGGPSDRTAHHRLRAWLVLHPGGRPRGRGALVSVDRSGGFRASARVRKWMVPHAQHGAGDRKNTRLNSSHVRISYAAFFLKKKKQHIPPAYSSHTLSCVRPYRAPRRTASYTYPCHEHPSEFLHQAVLTRHHPDCHQWPCRP